MQIIEIIRLLFLLICITYYIGVYWFIIIKIIALHDDYSYSTDSTHYVQDETPNMLKGNFMNNTHW